MPSESRADRKLRLRCAKIGVLVALLWIAAALPDLVATFFGERATNDISFTPAWLKAIRDLTTVAAVLVLGYRTTSLGLFARAATLIVTAAYFALGLARGTDPLVSFRGVIWLIPLVWAATTAPTGVAMLALFNKKILRLIVPVAIFCSLILGLLGAGMYYESIGPYERNPGLFLTPSATAFMAAIAILIFSAESHGRRLRWGAYLMGALTLSGVFYLNTLLFFGRLPRLVYLSIACGATFLLWWLGLDNLIDLLSGLNSGPRDGGAVSATLAARVLIFQDAIANFSVLGNYPLGLNVAANNSVDLFFPDNAYLAITYAFGVPGAIASIALTLYSLKSRHAGVFLLILTTGMFYVWFENSLFAALVGFLLNNGSRESLRISKHIIHVKPSRPALCAE